LGVYPEGSERGRGGPYRKEIMCGRGASSGGGKGTFSLSGKFLGSLRGPLLRKRRGDLYFSRKAIPSSFGLKRGNEILLGGGTGREEEFQKGEGKPSLNALPGQ